MQSYGVVSISEMKKIEDKDSDVVVVLIELAQSSVRRGESNTKTIVYNS